MGGGSDRGGKDCDTGRLPTKSKSLIKIVTEDGPVSIKHIKNSSKYGGRSIVLHKY